MSEVLLRVDDLHTAFTTDNGEVQAVNGISFDLNEGEILGIVGESGSGKSVTAYSIMQILAGNGYVKSGNIFYKGKDILQYSSDEMKHFRGKCCSIIFQDPMTSLNPVFTIGNQLKEAIKLHTDKKSSGFISGAFLFIFHLISFSTGGTYFEQRTLRKNEKYHQAIRGKGSCQR